VYKGGIYARASEAPRAERSHGGALNVYCKESPRMPPVQIRDPQLTAREQRLRLLKELRKRMEKGLSDLLSPPAEDLIREDRER
jgi:hypothetical protein